MSITATDLDFVNDDASITDEIAVARWACEYAPHANVVLTHPRTANAHPRIAITANDGPALWSILVTYCGGDEDEASSLASDAS